MPSVALASVNPLRLTFEALSYRLVETDMVVQGYKTVLIDFDIGLRNLDIHLVSALMRGQKSSIACQGHWQGSRSERDRYVFGMGH